MGAQHGLSATNLISACALLALMTVPGHASDQMRIQLSSPIFLAGGNPTQGGNTEEISFEVEAQEFRALRAGAFDVNVVGNQGTYTLTSSLTELHQTASGLSGTFLSSGIYPLDLTVTDENDRSFSKSLQITVNPALVPAANAPASIPANTSSQFTGTATGDLGITGDLIWTIAANPYGVVVSPQGVVTVPALPIQDLSGLKLIVQDPHDGASAETPEFSINVAAPPLEVSYHLTSTTVAQYTVMDMDAPTVVNSTGNRTYALGGPALPAGLTFSTSTGKITGQVTATGTFGPYSITVTDASGASDSTPSFSMTVTPVAVINSTENTSRQVSVNGANIGTYATWNFQVAANPNTIELTYPQPVAATGWGFTIGGGTGATAKVEVFVSGQWIKLFQNTTGSYSGKFNQYGAETFAPGSRVIVAAKWRWTRLTGTVNTTFGANVSR